MNILCLDTSGKTCSAAIATEKKIVVEQYVNNGLTHSSTLMCLIDHCFAYAAMKPQQLDLLALTTGPGSFTGLRIGMSVAKAIAQCCHCCIVQIGTLDAIALNAEFNRNALVCSMIDARHERVFCSVKKDSKELLNANIYSLKSVQLFLEKYPNEEIIFAGDGADVYGEELLGKFSNACIAPEFIRYPRASSMVKAVWEKVLHKEVFSAYDSFVDYFIVSQAERKLKE